MDLFLSPLSKLLNDSLVLANYILDRKAPSSTNSNFYFERNWSRTDLISYFFGIFINLEDLSIVLMEYR